VKNPTLSELRQQAEQDSRRWQRWCLWGAGVFVFWIVVGFFLAPPILRGQLEKKLSATLHRPVAVGEIRLNPLTLSVTVESFAITEPSGAPFIGWQRLFVNFDAFSFLLREWRFQDIALDGFFANVAVAKEGRLNFADLMESSSGAPGAKPSTSKAWPLLVRRLAINGSQLTYADASRAEPFSTDIGPTNVSLLNFSTGRPKQAPGEFTATTESGETFSWRGALSLAPLRSSGDVAFGKIALKKYAPFYADRVRFDLRDGRLDVALHYDFSIENGAPALRVSNGHVGLHALQIARRGESDPVIALNEIELTGLAATYPKLSAEVARVAVTGGSIIVRRDPDGIDLVRLLTPVAAATEAPPAVAVTLPSAAPVARLAPAPLDAKIAEIAVRDLVVTVEDRTTPRLARHELSELNCNLHNFSFANPEVPMPFGFSARLAPAGLIKVAGTLALAPLKAELGVELGNIMLSNISPYAESFVNLRIGKGRLSAALNLRVVLPKEEAPVLGAQGEVSVADFAAYDAASIDELAGWRSLAIKGIDYQSAPAKLMIGEIIWTEPSGHLIVNADGTNNLSLALQPQGAAVGAPSVAMPAAATAVAAKAHADEPIFIALERFVLEDAAFDFVDRTLQPNVRMALSKLSGQIDGLASSELARATVDLHGKVDGVAPVAVTGKINPLAAQAFTDLKVSMKKIELLPAGPYVGKFAGYELARGSLSLDVKCRVAQQKIDCANVVTIDQFTFGNTTGSPDATKLPVRLAVALLRDTSGRIMIDVPVRGRLNDPDFRVGRVVLRVFTNLLAKAATSPFSLIGSLFGAEKDQDLSFLLFAAGEAEPVNEEEVKKLDVVAKALLGRPTLQLELAGGYDRVADGPALRELALEKQMRNLVWADRRQMEPEITLDQIQLDPVQKAGMVRRFYYKTFPKEAPRRTWFNAAADDSGRSSVSAQRGDLGSLTRRAKAKVSLPPPTPKKPTAPEPGETVTPTPGPKTLTVEGMKARLLEKAVVDEEAFRQLAAERASAVREYLVTQGQVPAERISLVAATADAPLALGTRVELRLK